MIAIKTAHLSKKFKDLIAVNDFSLEVPQGELFALLGINGAGKTTVIKMLSCLTKPTSGEAFIMEKSVEHEAQDVKRFIGVSPQETAIAPNLSVRENLELMCGIYGFSKEKTKTQVHEIALKLKLNEVLRKKAGKLSGGWQRRLSIAMALIGEPSVLFLDEPTLGLDVIARSELWELIRALKGRVTVILTTHYLEEAQQLCKRVAFLNHGKIVESGSPQQIVHALGAFCVEYLGETHLFKEQKEAIAYLQTCSSQANLRDTNLEDVFFHLSGGRN
jgi:ABC-2 type transport system ATP-binding protein